MELISSTRGLKTRRWSTFDREGSSVVDRIDISAHLPTAGFGIILRGSRVIAHDTLNLAYRHWRGLDESAIQMIETVTRQTRKQVASS
jgi:hypothetical protein